MLIFGYGSILWKVDFPHEMRIVGYIKGYIRRFYQHSTDHRGTPEKPGRVVTLLPSDNPEAKVWGVAYSINPSKEEEVINYLDFRERGGYEQKYALFYPKENPENPIKIMTYVATTENKQYAGEEKIENIARQISSAIGPSGPNVDYVFNLANTMREIAPGIHDEHLFSVETELKNILEKS